MSFELTRKRRLGSLLAFLGAVAAIAAFCFIVGRVMPALQDLFRPIYILLALTASFYTYRWMRPRKGDRRESDRREHGDASHPL